MHRFITIAAVWAVAATLLWWAHMPGRWRRLLALLASGTGLVFLILAMSTEGVRESPTMGVFLLGTPYVAGQASASASLPYYVVTAVCLLLGTVGLAAGDEAARRLVRSWMAAAIGLGIVVTVLRFCLEKVAAPAGWSYAVGIFWLPPVVGAFYALSLRAEGRGFRELMQALAIYAFAVRGFVAAVAAVASTLRLGSHYDVTPLTVVRFPFGERVYTFVPGSFDQILYVGVLPQILFWPLFTLVASLAGAAAALLVVSTLPTPRLPSVPLPAPEADR